MNKNQWFRFVIVVLSAYPALLAIGAGAIGILTFNPFGLMFAAAGYLWVKYVYDTHLLNKGENND